MAIDLSAITSQFVPTNIIPTLLVVVGTAAVLIIWSRAMGFTLAAIRGDLGQVDRKLQSIRNEFANIDRERDFSRRYARESRNREYRAWKRSKGMR